MPNSLLKIITNIDFLIPKAIALNMHPFKILC